MWNRRNGLAAMVGAFVITLAGIGGAFATAAHASTPHVDWHARYERLAGACVGRKTFEIDGVTYRCRVVNMQTHPGATVKPKHVTTCKWRDSHATVLCVHRAPREVCREALATTLPCWRFTGSDTQVIWDWKGIVTTS